MSHRVFDLKEVANYLHIAQADVQRLVRNREIPFEKKGDRLVFRRSEVDVWASQRILGLSGKRLDDYHKTSSAKTYDLSKDHAIIADLLKVEYIDASLRSKTKPSVLSDMMDLADRTGHVQNVAELKKTIHQRELMCSTALSGGMALLHPHSHQPYLFDDSFIALGRTIQPIPFGAPDGMATDIFFMICCQDDRLHLHVLARLCTICHHTGALLAIREAETPQDVHGALVGAEVEVIRGLG
ncbi:MAG: PTS sugar transporter subunit IIA [bacterium]